MNVLDTKNAVAINIQRFNDAVEDIVGDDRKEQYRLEYVSEHKIYKVFHPDKPKGERRSIAQINEFLTALRKENGGDDELANLLTLSDPLALMNTGVLARGKGHLFIGKSYELFRASDDADYEKFGAEVKRVHGVEVPSEATCKKAGKVFVKWIREPMELGLKVPLEKLLKASMYKLYRIADAVSKHDYDAILQDAITLTEEQLVEKYLAKGEAGSGGIYKNLPRLQESDYNRFQELIRTVEEEVAKPRGQHAPTPTQALTGLVEIAFALRSKFPETFAQLWAEVIGSAQEPAPEPPRMDGGALDIGGLTGGGYSNAEVMAMAREGKFTPQDVADHPILEEVMKRATQTGPEAPDWNDDEAFQAMAVAEANS